MPCELGQELQQAPGSGSNGGGSDSAVVLTSCRQCRRDQLGLWNDTRPPLPSSSPPPAGASSTSTSNSSDAGAGAGAAAGVNATAAILEALAGAAAVTRDLLGLSTEAGADDACDACCVPCPDGATCAGGALLIPQPGYWHRWAACCPYISCFDTSRA